MTAGPALLAAIACALAVATGARVMHAAPAPLFERLSTGTIALGPSAEHRIARVAWQGGPTTASTGETVNVEVADAIPDPAAVAQKWANFFAGLLHGPELQLLTAYVVPGTEVGSDCGGDSSVLGCYGGQQLIIPNDIVYDVTPAEIARHEYGHHVANNRTNPPWRAVDWGPKRWASLIGVCASTQQGLFFPGNEDDQYKLNPGEAWAETYRVLNETKAGLPVTWPIVDQRFLPDANDLAAAEQDVTAPWATPTVHVYRSRFTRTRRAWTLQVLTPLDGQLQVTLTLRRGHAYRLNVFGADGRTVLGTGLWTAPTAQAVSFTICGQRSVLVRVVGDGKPAPFTVVTSTP
jgi:hypothetical protein